MNIIQVHDPDIRKPTLIHITTYLKDEGLIFQSGTVILCKL